MKRLTSSSSSSSSSSFLFFLFLFGSLISNINGQQEYTANSVLACKTHKTKPSSAFLYTCDGQNSSCLSFLMFKSEPPCNSVASISALMASNALELARINNVTRLAVFPTGKEVIVPVNCSCGGQYYQANTTFSIPTVHDTYFSIAKNTFQGLSTCSSLKRANQYSEFDLMPHLELNVPLRCACPGKKQIEEGIKYLLTYTVDWSDTISNIAERFNVSARRVLEANGFSEENPTLFPFTTLLIPFLSEPSSSKTIIRTHKDVTNIPPQTNAVSAMKKGSKRRIYTGFCVAAGSVLVVSLTIFFTLFLLFERRKNEISPMNNEQKGKWIVPKDLLVEISSIDQVLRVLKYQELKKATDNFSSRSRIKGAVYRGKFSKEVLAVKKMSSNVSTEVNILRRINHINLINLQGVCERQGCFYLIFEYMPNSSLRDWLRQRGPEEEGRSWERRIQIAIDIANGLHSLHSFTKPGYVHKDLKSSNVLLDGNLRAKIQNFGVARTTVKERKRETTVIAGTRGYLSPEYVGMGLVGPEMDVYAFGVVMLELITGRDAVVEVDGCSVLLSDIIRSVMEGGKWRD
ncbi:Non-specific serine/threonine protein kinase [Bertholletia excelsa]